MICWASFQFYVAAELSFLVERHDQIASMVNPMSQASETSPAQPHAEMIDRPRGVLSYPRPQAAQKFRNAMAVAIMLRTNNIIHTIHLYFRLIILPAQQLNHGSWRRVSSCF